ncbi:MAG: TIM44-like domain-containing protein [Spirochaetes bacterium]|nr:TIM44-like domain-containing protein [Spirochaetota bacterium]
MKIKANLKKVTQFLFWISQRRWLFLLLIGIFFIFLDFSLFSRAGGAGGSSRSSGGGGDGIGALIYFILYVIPFPYNFITIIIILIIYAYTNRKVKQKSVFNHVPGDAQSRKINDPGIINNHLQDFDEEQFYSKVRTAFIRIQQAWMEQDLSKVRKFISDGVYQRFHTQFKMMQLLDQKNIIDDLQILDMQISKIEADGQYDIIDVAIQAHIIDHFKSTKHPSLQSGGDEIFVEYWSFLKKRGTKTADLYHSNNCPKCGAELTEMSGEISKCEFCQTITNLGEFDWVLAEITQADDYVTGNPRLNNNQHLKKQLKLLRQENPDFAVQLLEDKVSNGYLQILTSRVLKKPEIMRRFVSDQVYEKIKASFSSDQIVYNRLYLNDVTLIGIQSLDTQNILAVAVKSSYQRVKLAGNKAQHIDGQLMSKTEILLLTHNKNQFLPKGFLYSHSCPSCGGPLEDTPDIKCSYCDAVLNSPDHEWIITDIQSIHEYQGYLKTNQASFDYKADPTLLDSLYGVRDFAFNNVLIMIAADGIFDPEEKEFAEKIARKWGYNINRIQPMFEMAKNGRLVIRMPESPKQRRKIYKLMEKTAAIDHNVSPEEELLLNNVKMTYLQ